MSKYSDTDVRTLKELWCIDFCTYVIKIFLSIHNSFPNKTHHSWTFHIQTSI